MVDTNVRVCVHIGDDNKDCTPASADTCWSFFLDADAIAETELPGDFEIRVYPNPFNSTCRIGIESGEWRVESVEIYNMNGRLVERIPAAPLIKGGAERSEAGGFFVWRPAPALGSGVYLVRARFDSRSLGGAETTATRRVVYLK